MDLYDDLPTAKAKAPGDERTKAWAPNAAASAEPVRERKTLGGSKPSNGGSASGTLDSAASGLPNWAPAQNKFLGEALRRKTAAKASSASVTVPKPATFLLPTVTIAQPNVLQATALDSMPVASTTTPSMPWGSAGPAGGSTGGHKKGRGGGRRNPMEEEYDPAKPNAYEDIKAEKRARRAQRKDNLLKDAMAQFGKKPTARETVDSPEDRWEEQRQDPGDMDYDQRQPDDAEEPEDEGDDGIPLADFVPMTNMASGDTGPKAPVVSLPGEDLSGEDAFLRRGQIFFQQSQQPRPPAQVAGPARPPVATSAPSAVICLLNLVGPGEVDDSVEGEVAEECAKFGKVTKVVIYEIPKAPADKAVRIFVQFGSRDSAAKAQGVMNGRFFGGRSVAAHFFDDGRFAKLDLAPKPNEWLQP